MWEVYSGRWIGRLVFPVTLDRSFKNELRHNGLDRLSPIHRGQRSNSMRRDYSSQFKGKCDSPFRLRHTLVSFGRYHPQRHASI
jgi:hypothetical protein